MLSRLKSADTHVKGRLRAHELQHFGGRIGGAQGSLSRGGITADGSSVFSGKKVSGRGFAGQKETRYMRPGVNRKGEKISDKSGEENSFTITPGLGMRPNLRKTRRRLMFFASA